MIRSDRHQQLLQEVSQELLGLRDVEETVAKVSERVGRFFGVSACLLSQCKEGEERSVSSSGWNSDVAPSWISTDGIKDWLPEEGWAKKKAEGIWVVRDTRSGPELNVALDALFGIRSFITVPVCREGQLCFAMSILDTQPRDWLEDDGVVLREIATRAWMRLERARVEAALRDSEEKYRALFENSEYGLVIVAPIFDANGDVEDLRYQLINPAFERQTGLRAADFLGKRLREALPGIESSWLAQFDRVAKSGVPTRSEEFNQHTGRWYEVVIFPHPNGLLAESFVDITVRKEIEEKARKNEDRQAFLLELHEALRLLIDPIAVQERVTQLVRDRYDADRCYYCEVENETAVIRSDATRGELRSVAGVYPLSGLPLLNDLARSGKALVVSDVAGDTSLDNALKQRCIQMQVLSFIHTPVIKQGEFAGSLCITQRTARTWTQAEIDLARAAAEQTWATVERGRVEAAFKDANTRLQEADERKNEFLAMLSHELRNPLAPITNSFYILDHARPDGAQAARAKQVVHRQVAQLSHLVNDLLDVTRITRNRIELKKEKLDLCEVVVWAIEDHRSLFSRAGAHVELEAATAPVLLIADRARVAQVMSNLLQNSAKFTTRGGRTRVSVVTDGLEAVVRFVDNGVGIAPEALTRLFQPFVQAAQSLDRSKGGLGLGLALVKGLVELHGGKVSAHSEGIGRGTEFVVRLPLALDTELEASPDAPRSSRPSRRVLIIEDNVDAASSLSEVLELGDNEVAVAYNGPEGIALAKEFHPDVVLCDIGLPEMDGYEVARTFRADRQLRGIFLVALSGYALPQDLQRATDAGFEQHLSKPLSLDKLEELLAGLRPS